MTLRPSRSLPTNKTFYGFFSSYGDISSKGVANSFCIWHFSVKNPAKIIYEHVSEINNRKLNFNL